MQPGSVELVVPDEEVKRRMEVFLGSESRFGARGVFVVKVREEIKGETRLRLF